MAVLYNELMGGERGPNPLCLMDLSVCCDFIYIIICLVLSWFLHVKFQENNNLVVYYDVLVMAATICHRYGDLPIYTTSAEVE